MPTDKADVLGEALAAVGALIAAFGGRLLLLEPPLRYPNVPKDAAATTIAFFGMLMLLLIISAIVRQRPERARYWILFAAATFALFLGMSAYYLYAVPRKSFVYEVVDSQDRFVFGDSYANQGAKLHRQFPDADPAELVVRAGGLDRINAVWTADSLDRARFHLTMVYVVILLLLAAAVFSIVEGVSKTRADTKKD